jgi:signal transduction histidine kinase
LKNGASLGLLGMRERAHSLRGQIVLRRLGRSGTVLARTIPLVVRAGAAPKRWASSAGG